MLWFMRLLGIAKHREREKQRAERVRAVCVVADSSDVIAFPSSAPPFVGYGTAPPRTVVVFWGGHFCRRFGDLLR